MGETIDTVPNASPLPEIGGGLAVLDPLLNPITVEKIFADIKVIAEKMKGESPGIELAQVLFRKLDPALNDMLKEEFSKHTNIAYNKTESDLGIEVSIVYDLKGQAIKNSDAPEDMDTYNKFVNLNNTGEIDRRTVANLIDRTPSLTGFTLKDAKFLVEGSPEEQVGTRLKFSEANQNILMGVAYTMMDNAPKENETHSSSAFLSPSETPTDYGHMAAVNVFYAAEDDKTFENWEMDQRIKIIDKISASPEIMDALAKIKSAPNIITKDDILEQYDTRHFIADKIGEIYAEVYSLETLDASDIVLAHKSLADFLDGQTQAFAWNSQAGVKNDELIVINYNPAVDIFKGDGTPRTNTEAQTDFIHTVTEELQHATDGIYADKLINDEIEQNHPAFDHTSIHLLNGLSYVTPERDFEGYAQQHIERTAKAIADDVSFEVVYRLNNPEDRPTPAALDNTTPQTPTDNDIPATAITGNSPKI